MKNETIILASGSPRRIEITETHGIHPIIIKPTCDERLPEHIGVLDAVRFLSLKKALSVEESILRDITAFKEKAASDIAGGADGGAARVMAPASGNAPVLIAADTVVYRDDLGIIGKPRDRDDAWRILTALRGKMHIVATGVTILSVGRPRRRTFCEVTKVFFKDYSDDELSAYLDTDEAYDKAGGYAIQGAFGKYIDHIEGDLNNVIGFPWDRIVMEFELL